MELKNIIQELSKIGVTNRNVFVKRHKDLMDAVLHHTKFLDNLYDDIGLSQRIYHVMNNIMNKVTCRVCNENLAIFGNIEIRENGKYIRKENGYKPCSKECRNKEHSIRTTKQVNSEEFKKTYKNTMLKKYGVDNPSKSKELMDKQRNTMISKFGVNHNFKTKEHKEYLKNRSKEEIQEILSKGKKTLINKYGVDHNSKIPGATNKRKKTLINKYGVDNPSKIETHKIKLLLKGLDDDYKLKEYKDGIITLHHKKCDNTVEITRNFYFNRKYFNRVICPTCNPVNKQYSIAEQEIYEFVCENTNLEVIKNFKIKNNSEIDIMIPEIKLGIEYNGSYYHSDLFKNKKFHTNKQKTIKKDYDVQTLFVWDSDWIHKQDIVKSIINGYLGNHQRIYARKCDIKELIAKDCKDFINLSHIQGFTPATVYYGLIYDDELIQVMSFKKIKDNNWEISRLCSRLNTQVVGGASRLFKHFLKNNKFDSLISYSLNDYFSGDIYKNLGFTTVKRTEPSYWYVDSKYLEKHNRQAFQKHKLVERGYDPKKTESEIMRERGYYRVFNCGNYKFLWVRPAKFEYTTNK